MACRSRSRRTGGISESWCFERMVDNQESSFVCSCGNLTGGYVLVFDTQEERM
jgi:hypothetical protein